MKMALSGKLLVLAPGLRKLAGAGVLLLMLGLSSACSVKFAYNNVDRLVRWQVSDYLDLDAEQKAYLQAEVRDLMAWHRANHLPLYANYLQALAVQFADGASESQIAGVFDQFLVWGYEMEDRALPAASHILSSLSDEQVAALPDKLEKSNLEIAEDELDMSLRQIQLQWAGEFEDVMERFTGRLDREQRAYIERRATVYIPERVLWAEYRRRWQADLLALLEHRHEVEEFARQFHALTKAREEYYGDEYTRISEQNIQLGREMVAYVLSNLSDKQSARFTESLQDLANDFEELAAQKGETV
jgi:hypothetical protein